MPPQTPQETAQISIPDFGDVTGLQYPSGIQQFCGIPYANLSKRWTRSTLNTSLSGGQHDGTQYGTVCPEPPLYKGDDETWVAVPQFPHFKVPTEDEFKCLNLNLILPGVDTSKPLPVMVWIHGGSFLFGSSAVPAYDMVNLVTHSAKIGKPVVGVSINYRTGLFGFLASDSIKLDLAKDGLAGVGNFGLTDQQVALQWVHRYISSVGGDPDNVTIFGESAGGMSVAHQIWAANPAPFRRAISMSGTLNTIPPWTLETHEIRYQAILSHLISQPESSAEGQLAQLRSVSQEDLASATGVMEGGFYGTGNPCIDGWYHAQPPSVDNITTPPKWLESYMISDVKDEANIFHGSLDDQDYNSIVSHFSKFLKEKDITRLFSLYKLTPELSHKELEARFEEMAADGIFKLHTYVHAHVSEVPKSFGYHLDQFSTFENNLKGISYHAIDLLYLFMNLEEGLTEGQNELSRAFASHFMSFAYGEDPWARVRDRKWMVYGPADKFGVKTEDEDEDTRRYGRMKEILDMGVFSKWVAALDHVVNKRWLLLNRAVKTE